ncbi:hemolysin family protein [Desulfobacca acetoxidans]|uniref:CBS domain containing protein n=1 Tax=Desulfobacca acetoxidans (strain ATCC 700848 / DSM 11109 / ASRB2) TaxID=880072 RepID=F2NHT3_DESAR|nr:hemolysin family protein [Desulfobacca acetoxidans]AEB09418.1 CBS domain containing protein [Desulfobacca acetoxidans DSM 11109]
MDEPDSTRPDLLRRLWRRWFRRRDLSHPEAIEKEIQSILEAGEERGFITRQEGEMIESIFEFKDTLAREIMVPRVDITCISQDDPIHQIIAVILKRGHSRLPVYQNNIDNIKGILLAKDLLVFWNKPESDIELTTVLRPAFFIPEAKKIIDLFRDFVEKKIQIAIVIDEYGGTSGLITIEDILEEIVGEIYDEYDTQEPRLLPQDDQSVIVDARLDIEHLTEHFGVEVPEGEFESVGGLMIHHLGKVPQVNDTVVTQDLEFTAIAADERRVKKIRVRALPSPIPESSAAGS